MKNKKNVRDQKQIFWEKLFSVLNRRREKSFLFYGKTAGFVLSSDQSTIRRLFCAITAVKSNTINVDDVVGLLLPNGYLFSRIRHPPKQELRVVTRVVRKTTGDGS